MGDATHRMTDIAGDSGQRQFGEFAEFALGQFPRHHGRRRMAPLALPGNVATDRLDPFLQLPLIDRVDEGQSMQ